MMPAIDLLQAPAAYQPDQDEEDDPNILMAQGQAIFVCDGRVGEI